MTDWRARIDVNPEVMVGKPVIRGTRVPVELIVRKVGEGATDADLLDAYPRLTIEDIRAAVLCAAHVLADEGIIPMNAHDDLPRMLGEAGYPGFPYAGKPRDLSNPAAVVLAALQSPDTPARVTEALPWMLLTFPQMNWTWLVNQAKLSNLQNRLGYLVHLARELATKQGSPAAAGLEAIERQLEAARLAKEDTLGRRLTEAERDYLRQHRPAGAAHWNLLTSLRLEEVCRQAGWKAPAVCTPIELGGS